MEVIGLVGEGKGNEGIATLPGIREQTVEDHLANLMRKPGAKNRLEAGVSAVLQKLAPPRPAHDGA